MKKKTSPVLVAASGVTDLRFAIQTIGDTAPARLAWLLGFLGEAPERWHPAVRAVHGACLVMLAIADLENVALLKFQRALTPDEILDLHTALRATVGALLTDNPTGGAQVSIPTDGLSERLVRTTKAGVKPAVFGVDYGLDNPRTAIFQAVKTLILRAGDRLIACPACRTPFLAVHKMQFCSPRCAQRARNERREDTRPRKTDRKKGRR